MINHPSYELLSILESVLRHNFVFTLKVISNGEKRKAYLNCLESRLLSDVRLLGVIGTIYKLVMY